MLSIVDQKEIPLVETYIRDYYSSVDVEDFISFLVKRQKSVPKEDPWIEKWKSPFKEVPFFSIDKDPAVDEGFINQLKDHIDDWNSRYETGIVFSNCSESGRIFVLIPVEQKRKYLVTHEDVEELDLVVGGESPLFNHSMNAPTKTLLQCGGILVDENSMHSSSSYSTFYATELGKVLSHSTKFLSDSGINMFEDQAIRRGEHYFGFPMQNYQDFPKNGSRTTLGYLDIEKCVMRLYLVEVQGLDYDDIYYGFFVYVAQEVDFGIYCHPTADKIQADEGKIISVSTKEEAIEVVSNLRKRWRDFNYSRDPYYQSEVDVSYVPIPIHNDASQDNVTVEKAVELLQDECLYVSMID